MFFCFYFFQNVDLTPQVGCHKFFRPSPIIFCPHGPPLQKWGPLPRIVPVIHCCNTLLSTVRSFALRMRMQQRVTRKGGGERKTNTNRTKINVKRKRNENNKSNNKKCSKNRLCNSNSSEKRQTILYTILYHTINKFAKRGLGVCVALNPSLRHQPLCCL